MTVLVQKTYHEANLVFQNFGQDWFATCMAYCAIGIPITYAPLQPLKLLDQAARVKNLSADKLEFGGWIFDNKKDV